MCGFTAIVAQSNKDEENCFASIAKMSYRGLPGHSVMRSHRNIHIGHVRLPIVDLTESGNQPAMLGERMGFLVGEVFNFKDFSDASTDTKAVLEVFVNEGLGGFHKFDGFWSFITIWQDKLFACTDYLSQKPIYYRTDMKAIASEPEALLEYGPADWDEVFFSNVKKWGYDPTGRTPWMQIKQLPAGHAWFDGMIFQYWGWNYIEQADLKDSIIEAVKNRLLGEQPIACLLSGGLDSSIVFSLCRQLGAKISSYHIENDEADFARLVDPDTKCLPLDGLAYNLALKYHQSPVDLGSVHPQAVLSQAVAKEGFHVCLTGDGADELFSGYSRSDKYDSQGSDAFVELPYYHLPRLDRLMMRNTIELRTPFLAPKVVKAAMNIPHYQRRNKLPLKDAFRDILPVEIVQREKLALKTLRIKTGGLKQIEDNIKAFKEQYK